VAGTRVRAGAFKRVCNVIDRHPDEMGGAPKIKKRWFILRY
jgi:hypothetical protein